MCKRNKNTKLDKLENSDVKIRMKIAEADLGKMSRVVDQDMM
jgi:hypothetical protein